MLTFNGTDAGPTTLPVEEHISRGLYGMMIIDPPTPRPQNGNDAK
jgi:hypothetical protein